MISEWVIREDLRSGRLVRVLLQWNAKEFPAPFVIQDRALPVRVRAFIDFAVKRMITELHLRVQSLRHATGRPLSFRHAGKQRSQTLTHCRVREHGITQERVRLACEHCHLNISH